MPFSLIRNLPLLVVLAVVLSCNNLLVSEAKIRGGNAASEFVGLLQSYDHDALLAGYQSSSDLRRENPGDKELAAVSQKLLHRIKNLRFLEEGMPQEEFDHLNDLMAQLDEVMDRVEEEDTTEQQKLDRKKSKELSRDIREIRTKYTKYTSKKGGLTEAQQERVRELRAQMADGISNAQKAKEVREELDLLYARHSTARHPKKSRAQNKRDEKKARKAARERKNKRWETELNEEQIDIIAKLRDQIKDSQDRDEVHKLREEIDLMRTGNHPSQLNN